MEIINIHEKEYGSATITIDLSEAEVSYLINYAINDIFLKKLEEQDNGR